MQPEIQPECDDFPLGPRAHHTIEKARFVVLHRFQCPGTNCLAGEEVTAVWFVHDDVSFQIRLSLALRLLFDHLGRYRWLAQSAAQIESSMRADPFYTRHAANARSEARQTRRIARSAVKTYIRRIRDALQSAFTQAGTMLKPEQVLVSEPMAGNEVGYRLRAVVRWIHHQ